MIPDYATVIADVKELFEGDDIARPVRHPFEFVDPERLIATPDCGMKYLTRGVVFQKFQALGQGTTIVRAELGICD